MRPITFICCLSTLSGLAFSSVHAAGSKGTWVDPKTARKEDPDFVVQGEYGSTKPGAAVGMQVVAMGDGKFEAWVLEGGLPGLG